MIVRSNLLITGYAGTPHVTAAQQGACNAAMYGTGKYVLGVGSQFAYEIVSNNLIKIQDGYAINQGRLMGIDNTLYEEMIIDNGLQGVKRVDLICMKYTQNVDTGVETVEMVIVKGTSGDTYADPSTVSGDILAGAAEDDFPLYRVKIDGINIVAVEPLFHIMVPAKKIMDKLGTTDISAIGDGTATGAISAINTNLVHIDAIGRDLTSDNNNHTLDISNYAFLIVTLRDNAVNSRTLEPIIISRPGELTEPISIDYCLHANNGGLYIVTSSMAINNTDKYFSFAETLMSHIGNIYGIQANAPSVIKVVGIPFSNNPK